MEILCQERCWDRIRNDGSREFKKSWSANCGVTNLQETLEQLVMILAKVRMTGDRRDQEVVATLADIARFFNNC